MSKSYITTQGDMWDSIAHKMMGSEKYTDRLICANPQYIKIHIFPSGIILNIPDIGDISRGDLPPWRRSSG